jgi:hypothetical protein
VDAYARFEGDGAGVNRAQRRANLGRSRR